jgi:two-component system, LuxR family, sensor kinase FixL
LTPSERKFGAIIQSSPVAMVMVGRTGNIEMFNAEAERIFGYTREEILSRPMEVLMPERYRKAHSGMRAHFFQAPAARIMGAGRELVAQRKDGSEFPVEIGLTPLKLEGETWILCTMVDISTRKKSDAEQRTKEGIELRQRERLATLEKLAGSVAHEIRTPLSVVQNSIFFLEQHLSQRDGSVDEVLSEMKRAVGNSNQIITEMLDFVRDPIPYRSVFPIGMALSDALLSVSLPEAVCVQDLTPEMAAIEVHANQNQVSHIFLMLFRNALQGMPEGGKLELAANQDENRKVCITVRDTGCGIPEENLEKIFHPLFSTKIKGLGLGLAVAQRYAAFNDGDLSVDSRLGQGTTFRLTLNSPA